MGKDKNAVEVIKPNSPADLIRLAVTGEGAKTVDLEKLEKLLELQMRHEANEAKKAYHVAMTEFKANPPEIDKDKEVAYNAVKYKHATLVNVTKKINKALSEHGLSASWITKQNGQVCVTCKITHEQGHSEETTLAASADTSGSKNAIQAIGSTITYLQRYTLLALTGLATGDLDDDGKASDPVEYVSKEQAMVIADNIDNLGIKQDKFFSAMGLKGISDYEQIPAKDFDRALKLFDQQQKINARKEKK